MVTELIRAVNYFTGNFQQPIKFELLATGAAVDVNSGCYWINENRWLIFAFYA